MNNTELCAAVRLAAYIADSDTEYTNAIIMGLASNMLWNTFGEVMVRSRQGYWRQRESYTLVAGTNTYRVSSRALANAVELIEVPFGTGYTKLHYVEPRDVGSVEGQSGFPVWYTIDADTIFLYPTPSSAITMRVKYAVRPSSLVAIQTLGVITGVTTLTITVDVPVPLKRSTGASLVVTDRVDVVHPAGAFDLGLVSALPSALDVGVGSATWTFPSGTDLTRVAVGDYIRAASETDWPMLPVEYHQTLADATAAEILMQKGMSGKAQMVAGKAQAAIEKMRTVMEPRVKWDPAALHRRNSNFGRRGPRFPIAPGGT